MTVEEILAQLEAIIAAAGSDPMSEAQLEEVETLERSLQELQTRSAKDVEARSRVQAYKTVTTPRLAVRSNDGGKELRAFDKGLRSGDFAEYRAQSEGTPSEGGYLVPAEWRDKLVECMYSFGGVMAEAETITTSTGATLEWATISDGADDAAIAARAGITPENSEFTYGGDLVFGQASLGAYKYTTTGPNSDPLRVSVELLQDSKFNIDDLVRKHFANRIGRAQARHFATGSGVSQPQGILNGTADVELVTANTFANAANGYAKLLEIEDSLDSAYLANARWVFNRTVWSQIRSIVDADGRPLIQASQTAGIGGKVGEYTLLGYPVTIDESFPNPAQNVNFMVFGDVRQGYVIRRVAGLTVVVNPWTRAEFGQVEYTGWERADALIQDRCAFSIVKGID